MILLLFVQFFLLFVRFFRLNVIIKMTTFSMPVFYLLQSTFSLPVFLGFGWASNIARLLSGGGAGYPIPYRFVIQLIYANEFLYLSFPCSLYQCLY